jgi:osmotically-inducible protein OsmY
MSDAAPEYLAQHLREALATDGRTAEQGIDVTVAGERLVLSGTAFSREQRDAIEVVAVEVAPGYEVQLDISVVEHLPAGPEEELT